MSKSKREEPKPAPQPACYQDDNGNDLGAYQCSHPHCGEPKIVFALTPKGAANKYHEEIGLISSPFSTECVFLGPALIEQFSIK